MPQSCYVLHLAKHCVAHSDVHLVGRMPSACRGCMPVCECLICLFRSRVKSYWKQIKARVSIWACTVVNCCTTSRGPKTTHMTVFLFCSWFLMACRLSPEPRTRTHPPTSLTPVGTVEWTTQTCPALKKRLNLFENTHLLTGTCQWQCLSPTSQERGPWTLQWKGTLQRVCLLLPE